MSEPSIGHNSEAAEPATKFAKDQLKSIIERIESVETEMKERMEDRKEIYLEAKSNGFDVPALKAIVARRRKDQEKLAALEETMDVYERALG